MRSNRCRQIIALKIRRPGNNIFFETCMNVFQIIKYVAICQNKHTYNKGGVEVINESLEWPHRFGSGPNAVP